MQRPKIGMGWGFDRGRRLGNSYIRLRLDSFFGPRDMAWNFFRKGQWQKNSKTIQKIWD